MLAGHNLTALFAKGGIRQLAQVGKAMAVRFIGALQHLLQDPASKHQLTRTSNTINISFISVWNSTSLPISQDSFAMPEPPKKQRSESERRWIKSGEVMETGANEVLMRIHILKIQKFDHQRFKRQCEMYPLWSDSISLIRASISRRSRIVNSLPVFDPEFPQTKIDAVKRRLLGADTWIHELAETLTNWVLNQHEDDLVIFQARVDKLNKSRKPSQQLWTARNRQTASSVQSPFQLLEIVEEVPEEG